MKAIEAKKLAPGDVVSLGNEIIDGELVTKEAIIHSYPFVVKMYEGVPPQLIFHVAMGHKDKYIDHRDICKKLRGKNPNTTYCQRLKQIKA